MPPSTTVVPDNPFHAALLDAAPLAYLSMIKAGLASQFDPLPRAKNGLGMVSSLLTSPLWEHGPELCAAMMALGLDPTDEQELSDSHHSSAWNRTRNELGRQHAPLASLAIATGLECYASLWRSLTPEKLLSISDTALPLALVSQNMGALDALIAAGADLDAKSADGTPPVARCQSAEAIQKMGNAGADLRAPLPADRRYKQAATALDYFLALEGMAADAKTMRAAALAWAAAHPPVGDPLAEFSASAFKALAEDNKDAARRCVIAMGPQAIERRDADGQSLALAAARARNYPELARLLGLGADPFEVSPDGQSAWGSLMAQKATPSHMSWATRALDERADALLEQIDTKKKYKPVPWTRVNAQGARLLESLLVDCPMPHFLSYAHSAFANGLDPRAPLSSGMDLPCDLALRRLRDTPWAASAQPRHGVSDLIEGFFEEHPLAASSPASKAELARQFWHALASPNTPLQRENARPPVVDLSSPRGEQTARALLDGFEQLGSAGWPAPDFDTLDKRWIANIKQVDRGLIASAHERGALAAASAPAYKPGSGPSRL